MRSPSRAYALVAPGLGPGHPGPKARSPGIPQSKAKRSPASLSLFVQRAATPAYQPVRAFHDVLPVSQDVPLANVTLTASFPELEVRLTLPSTT